MSATLGEIAAKLAGKGFRIFPTHSIEEDGRCSCSRECGSPGKHPITRNGSHDATGHQTQIAEWWGRWPRANIAIATGEGLVVIDLDGDPGITAWAALTAGEEMPKTVSSVTGGGGRHLYFLTSIDLPNSHWKLGEHIDTRGRGGYVLAPPSNHRSGNRYSWLADAPGISPLPSWVEALLKPSDTFTPSAQPIVRGETTAYGDAILRGALERVRSAPEGTRNETLNAESFNLGQWIGGGEIDPRGVADALAGACQGPDKHKNEATIRRALSDGLNHPRAKEQR